MNNTTAITICDDPTWRRIWTNNVGKYMPYMVFPSDTYKTGGSMKHGHGINEYISRVETEYVLIMDADCLLLEPFEINQDVLSAQKTDTTIHMCFLAGRTEVLKEYDYSPQGYGPCFTPETDVGSRIGVPNNDLKLIDCKTGQGKVYGSDIQCDEIWYSGKVIGTHFGRGGNLKSKIVRDDRENTNTQLEKWLKGVE